MVPDVLERNRQLVQVEICVAVGVCKALTVLAVAAVVGVLVASTLVASTLVARTWVTGSWTAGALVTGDVGVSATS